MIRKKQTREGSESSSRNGTAKFNTAEYFNRAGVDPLMETQLVEFRSPTSGVRASVAGVPAFDPTEARLGMHFLRIPYFSREYWHAAYRDMWKWFTSMETGGDINMLDRFSHLKLVGVAGLTVDSNAKDVALQHVNLRMGYRYHSTHLALKAVAILNLARKNGYGNISASMQPTLKFSVINSMFSKIANFPIDRAYFDACVGAMADLVLGDNEHGLFVSVPDWLPVGQTYVEQTKDLGDTGLWSKRTSGPCFIGEYIYTNTHRVAFDHTQRGFGLTADPTGAGTWTSVKPLSKAQGYFYDKYLEQLQAEVDMFYDTFCNNSISDMNLAIPGNKVADYYAAAGDFTDRITFTDIVKAADGIQNLDLQSYVAQNFKFMQEAGPVANFTQDLSLYQGMDATALAAVRWHLPTRDYVEQVSDTADMAELPYAHLTIASGSNLDEFLDGRAADIVGDGTFDVLDYELSMKTIIQKKLKSVLTTTYRYVDAKNKGSWLRSSADSNIMCLPSLTRRGTFLPFWKVTPFIDPNDRMANGFFTVLDMKNAAPRKGTWEDIIKQVCALPAFQGEWTAGTVAAAKGEYTWSQNSAADDDIWATYGSKIGAALLFIGDAPGVPASLHLLRGDVPFLAKGSATITGNHNWIPASPYRRVPVDLGLSPLSAGGTYTPMLTGLTAAFTTLKDGITVSALDSAMTNTIILQNPKASPEMILAPLFAPSLRRPICEFTDHGLYLWEKNFFDYEAKPSFSVPSLRGGAPSSPVQNMRGRDQQKDKAADRAKERESRPGGGRFQRDAKPDFRKEPRRGGPKKAWQKKLGPVDPKGNMGEAGAVDVPVKSGDNMA